MLEEWKCVKDFHLKFGHPVSEVPVMLQVDRVRKRYAWILEEMNEFIEAEDIVEQADAMIDVIYFAFGTLVEMGIEPDEIFKIVHKANMNKLWDDGKPHYNADGKTIKPDTWENPYNKIEEAINRAKEQSGSGSE